MKTNEKEYFKAGPDDIVYTSSILGNEISYNDQELQDIIERIRSVAVKISYDFDEYPRKFNN